MGRCEQTTASLEAQLPLCKAPQACRLWLAGDAGEVMGFTGLLFKPTSLQPFGSFLLDRGKGWYLGGWNPGVTFWEMLPEYFPV